jgi:hypothetical protein
VATLIAAVGTVAAIFTALYQISVERSARHADKRAALARDRIAQAKRISAWIRGAPRGEGRGPHAVSATFATVLNASQEPVYRVVVWLVFVQGAAPERGEEMIRIQPSGARMLGTLPPGAFVVSLPGDWGGMHRHPGVEVAFTDAAGLHWIRRASGAVDSIPEDPLDHYGIAQPVDWEVPVAAS